MRSSRFAFGRFNFTRKRRRRRRTRHDQDLRRLDGDVRQPARLRRAGVRAGRSLLCPHRARGGCDGAARGQDRARRAGAAEGRRAGLSAYGRRTDGAAKALAAIPAKVTDQDASILSATLQAGAPSLAFIDEIRDATHARLCGGRDTRQPRAERPRRGATLHRCGAGPAGHPNGARRARHDADRPSACAAGGASRRGGAGRQRQRDRQADDSPGADRPRATPICDPEVVKDQSEAEAWRLQSGKTLFALACTQGAYNLGSALYLADADGANATPVALPRPPALQGDAAANVVVNAGFDPKTMQLALPSKRGAASAIAGRAPPGSGTGVASIC